MNNETKRLAPAEDAGATEHKWKMQRMGGNPANAESYEWVRFCEVCGIEDTCEDPLPPCSPVPPVDAARPELPPCEPTVEEVHAGVGGYHNYSMRPGGAHAALLCRERQLLATLRENEGLREQRDEFERKGKDLCQAHGNLLLEHKALRAELDAIRNKSEGEVMPNAEPAT